MAGAGNENAFMKIAKMMFWSLVTLFNLLAYVAEIRPFFNSILGTYYLGLVDGIVVTILALIACLYMASRT